jgi:hypothetical protein
VRILSSAAGLRSGRSVIGISQEESIPPQCGEVRHQSFQAGIPILTRLPFSRRRRSYFECPLQSEGTQLPSARLSISLASVHRA